MKKIILYLILTSVVMAACYDEGDLTPSENPELIYGKYTLPQGNHDYDKELVKFYKDYSSLILYKFTSKDFGWSPTDNVAFDVERDTVLAPGTSRKYDILPAQEEYVGKQWDLLKNKWLNYLSDTLLKMLPQKILLCSKMDLVETGLGHAPTEGERERQNVYSGFYHMAVNWGDEKILAMTPEERNLFKKEVCSAFFKKIIKKLKGPESFFVISKYSENMPEDKIYENGILDANSCASMERDWFDYIKLAIENTIDQLEGEGGVLNPAVDVNGLIRKKYDIMVDFLNTNYKFDIQKIGNDVE